ncbi:MAG: hypothetical protein ABH830_03280 [Patescibacteria group bacterium]
MDNLTIENLNAPVFIDELEEKINKIEFFNDKKGAYYFLKDLEKFLLKNENSIRNTDALNFIQILIAKLKFILFNSLNEEEILDIFSKYLSVGIKMAYIDLVETLKMRISLIPINKRDELKEKIKKVILNNEEEITKKSIIDNQTNIKPTISAWLKLYNKELGAGFINNLVQNKFYISNPNFISLSDLEKLELKELYNIYEYIKRSSLTIEGNEDDIVITDIDEKNYWLHEGRFIELKGERQKKKDIAIVNKDQQIKKESNLGELQKIVTQYPPGSLERKAIEEEIARYQSGGGNRKL